MTPNTEVDREQGTPWWHQIGYAACSRCSAISVAVRRTGRLVRHSVAWGSVDISKQRPICPGSGEMATEPIRSEDRHGNQITKNGRPKFDKRFWSKVKKTEGCWEWLSRINRDGYGAFRVNKQVRSAHRVAYELLIGPIPEELTLDHLCRNRACVNPSHLEPVSRGDNIRRGATARRNQLNGY